jgi:hypothetical protein
LQVYDKRLRLGHLAAVGVVFSQYRPSDGPKQTKIFVTKLPETVTAPEIVGLHQRRLCFEFLMKELQGLVGLRQHQVTKQAGSVEPSGIVAFMAYLLLLKLRANDILAGRRWNASRLPRRVLQRSSWRSASVGPTTWLSNGSRWSKRNFQKLVHAIDFGMVGAIGREYCGFGRFYAQWSPGGHIRVPVPV